MSSNPLSLPSSSSAPEQPKKRKRSKIPPRTTRGVDYERALDENDDVSDTELVAPPLGSRAIDEDYDEDEEVEHDEGVQEDHEGHHDGAGEGRTGGVGGAKGKGLERAKKGGGKDSGEDELGKRNKRLKGEQLMLRTLMDPDQAKRFDAFSSVVVPKGPITRLNRELYDQKIQGNLPAMLAGMTKIFVTDVVELAKELQPHSTFPTGRLRPYHLRLARDELERRGVLGGSRRNGESGTALRSQKPLFRR